MNDTFDNIPKDPKSPSIPNAGVNTGVTDTYGGGLEKGYQDEKKIERTGTEASIGYC